MRNTFCAKVLLFGEYSVVKGGKGLAAPLSEFCGELQFGQELGPEHKEKFFEFCRFMQNSKTLGGSLDLEKFKSDIKNGLYFKSNIPQGAGVGSSGALCAAIYAGYSKLKKELTPTYLAEVLDHMALMESFYHGSSSGLDPLISYAQRPVSVENRNKVELVDFKGGQPDLYLINTKTSRKTSPLVQKFLQMCEDPDFNKKVKKFVHYSNRAIEAFLGGDIGAFEKNMYEISKWQFLNLRPMVCEQVAELWLEGLESKRYFIKLCGAGGGGHYLVYKKSPEYSLKSEGLKIKF